MIISSLMARDGGLVQFGFVSVAGIRIQATPLTEFLLVMDRLKYCEPSELLDRGTCAPFGQRPGVVAKNPRGSRHSMLNFTEESIGIGPCVSI